MLCRGTKTDEDYSDILSPEIAIQTYEGKTDPPLTNPPSQKDTSSVSSAVISPQINEEEPNIKILESWEKDVEPCSTVAPVLWALDHMKFTLEKKTGKCFYLSLVVCLFFSAPCLFTISKFLFVLFRLDDKSTCHMVKVEESI